MPVAEKQSGPRSGKILRRLLAVIFGLVLAFLLAEIGLRIFYHALPERLQIALRDVRISPFSDARLAPPPLWQPDTRYLTIVNPGAQDSLQAGSPDVLFHVSSYSWWNGRVGFRTAQPTDGTVEAVALGDSFTFCFTEIDSCWVSRLAQATGLKIANMGQPVTGSESHQRVYEDFIGSITQLKQPKLVLWQFYGNDFNDDYGLARLEGTNKTPPPPDPATGPTDPPFKQWLREHSIVYALIGSLVRTGNDPGVEMFVDPYRVQKDGLDLAFGQSYIRDSFDMTQARNQEGETLSDAAILKVSQEVEANGGKFVLILFPTKEQVYRSLAEPLMSKDAIDSIAEPYKRITALCEAQHLTCFDLLPALQAQANHQLYYATDPHLNVDGNAVAADAIAKFLQDQGIAQKSNN